MQTFLLCAPLLGYYIYKEEEEEEEERKKERKKSSCEQLERKDEIYF